MLGFPLTGLQNSYDKFVAGCGKPKSSPGVDVNVLRSAISILEGISNYCDNYIARYRQDQVGVKAHKKLLEAFWTFHKFLRDLQVYAGCWVEEERERSYVISDLGDLQKQRITIQAGLEVHSKFLKFLEKEKIEILDPNLEKQYRENRIKVADDLENFTDSIKGLVQRVNK